MTQTNQVGDCLLCGESRALQASHVLPAFAFKWLRQTSGNGHVRSTRNPNQRVQDGIKHRWLCTACELRLSDSEGRFSKYVFHPYLAAPESKISYGSWMMLFCISVSWRTLHHFREVDDLGRFSDAKKQQLQHAERVWRECLLGLRPHPSQFQQHLIPVGEIETTTATLSANINRYLMRAIDMDICQGGDVVFTYAKLGRFIIVGFVNEPDLNHWQGTKIHVKEGIVAPRRQVVPSMLLEYINHKAISSARAISEVSSVQHAKIDESFRKTIDSYAESDAFVAMRADVERFGDDAFIRAKFRTENGSST